MMHIRQSPLSGREMTASLVSKTSAPDRLKDEPPTVTRAMGKLADALASRQSSAQVEVVLDERLCEQLNSWIQVFANKAMGPAGTKRPAAEWARALDDMMMSKGDGGRSEALAALHHVEKALRRWDPIGVMVGEGSPQDEYDSYAPHIVSLLTGGASITDITTHLERIRTITIGLPADRIRDAMCAEELIAWWKQREQRS